MELLKRRNFNSIFNDTFTIIKEDGKHFFKNYIILNGLPLFFFLILLYFLTTTFYGLSTYGTGNTDKVIASYIENNSLLFIVLSIITIVVSIIFLIIQYGFVPVYLFLYRDHNGANFSAKDIFDVLFKQKIGKILIFMLASTLVFILIFIPLVVLVVISIFTIVGIFLVLGFVVVWFNNAFMEYMDSGKGVFQCFIYGFKLIFIRFWDYAGSIGLLLLMTTFVNGSVSFVTSLFTVAFTANAANHTERDIITTILFVFSFVVSKMISLLVQTIVQLGQGIVYFSAKEQAENIAVNTEIDKIGASE